MSNSFSGAKMPEDSFLKNIEVAPPPAHVLFAGLERSFLFPVKVRQSKKLKRQANERKKLVKLLDGFFSKTRSPKMEVDEALSEKIVSPTQVNQLYQSLSDFLEADDNNARIILYLPFTLLPSARLGSKIKEVAQTAKRFRSSYLKSWHKLLTEKDLRANFVDGDVLEDDLGTDKVSRVCKAAHLIPELIKKKLICVFEVIELLKGADNQILANSILDTLPVLADLSLLPKEYEKLINIPEAKPPIDTLPIETSFNQEPKEGSGQQWLDGLLKNLKTDTGKIGPQRDLISAKMTKARIEWQKREDYNELIRLYSNLIAKAVRNSLLKPTDLKIFMLSDSLQALLGITAIGKAVEELAEESMEKAKDLHSNFSDALRTLWLQTKEEIGDKLISIYSHWLALGIVDTAYLAKLGLEIPRLDAVLSNKKSLKIEKEIRKSKVVVKTIESDPELSRFLYPVCIIFGSRLKGYALSNADHDIALLVKPDIDPSERPRLKNLLGRVASTKASGTKFAEFWLEEKEDGLAIKNFSTKDSAVAEITWMYLLFHGVWLGRREDLLMLHEKLLSKYLALDGKKLFGMHDARKVYLREMERDVLQYRLMHRGYSRFYPRQDGLQTKNSRLVDSNSTFWDPGFRRLATKLFLTRVFLPKI
ncbi:MAG TPA: hypothetical protein VI978_01950 [Candidatus Paceibacterota bacterium]